MEHAIAHYRARIEAAPQPLSLINELAQLCLRARQLTPALEAYEAYLGSHPDSATGHFNYAWYADKAGRHARAIEHYQRALALGIARPEEVHLNIAKTCADGLRDDARARQQLEAALRINPGYPGAWFNLGNLAEQQGQLQEAQHCFRHCLELDPGNHSALARLADASDFRDSNPELLQQLLAAARTHQDPDLLFAAGRALEQRGDYASAWHHFSLANAEDRRHFPAYDPGVCERRTDQIIAVCNSDWIARLRQEQPSQPLFICGMFRSGSTLIEQILAAHPAFTPAGERDYFPRLRAAHLPDYPQGLDRLETGQLDEWARAYVQESQALFAGAGRLTDKRPDNFLYLGLIKAMFPRAQIVISQRDWRDVAVSLFANRLGPAAHYATDLGNIRHYMQQHERLLGHWCQLFGEDIIQVQYETLVDGPRLQIERLLQALGESWDERCLDFHQLRNTVRTASVWQVRQPLYSSSVGRWRNYPAVEMISNE